MIPGPHNSVDPIALEGSPVGQVVLEEWTLPGNRPVVAVRIYTPAALAMCDGKTPLPLGHPFAPGILYTSRASIDAMIASLQAIREKLPPAMPVRRGTLA